MKSYFVAKNQCRHTSKYKRVEVIFQSSQVGDRMIPCIECKILQISLFVSFCKCVSHADIHFIILPTDTAFFAVEGIFIHGGIMAACWAEIFRHDCVAAATSLAIFIDLKLMKETRVLNFFFSFGTLSSISCS